MLPYQHKTLETRKLKLKALAGAWVIYLLLIALLIVPASWRPRAVHVKICSGSAVPSSVLFMQKPKKQTTKQAPKAKALAKQTQPEKKAEPKPAKKIQKTPEKKIEKSAAKKTPEQKIPEVAQRKAAEPKLAPEKPKQEPQEPAKTKTVPEQKAPVQPEPKKEIPKPEPQIKSEDKPEKKPEQKIEPKVQENPEVLCDKLQEETVYLCDSQVGIEGGQAPVGWSKAHVALNRAVIRAWKAPEGVAKGATAQLVVQLGKNGGIESVAVEKSSSILAYDLSARAALWRTEYPNEFWGKKIVLIFGSQE